MRVGEASFERWLATRQVQATTRKAYWGAYHRMHDGVDQPDLVARFSKLEHEYARSTVQLTKIVVKSYYSWLGLEDQVAWIRGQRLDAAGRVRECLLDDDEVMRLVEACYRVRDKALIAVAWETGVRRGELLSMRLRDGQRTSYGYKWLVSGKTGTRPVWLIRCAPWVTQWLSVHPTRRDRSSRLWARVKRSGALRNTMLNVILKQACRRAGIRRRVHWHMFRHTAATRDARRGLTEAQLEKKYGWSRGSRMPGVYVHLAGTDVERAVLALEGIEDVERPLDEGVMRPRRCVGCGVVNAFDMTHCSGCGLPLTAGEAEDLAKKQQILQLLLDKLSTDPKKMKQFTKFLEGL